MSTISVVGTGYVGLVTGACFADLGNRVTCIDVDERKIAILNNGGITIYEPGLEEIVERNVRAGRLNFTTSYEDGLAGTEFVFVAVNTPPGLAGEADMTYARAAARSIAEHLRDAGHRGQQEHDADRHGRLGRRACSTGTAEWRRPSSRTPSSCARARPSPTSTTRIGSSWARTTRPPPRRWPSCTGPLNAPVVITDLRTAEMIKYASNAFLATKISFINEIASICEKLGADVTQVARGHGSRRPDRRGVPGRRRRATAARASRRTSRRWRTWRRSRAATRSCCGRCMEINRDARRSVVLKLRAALGAARRGDDRRAGAGVQAEHRRPARGGRRRGHPPAPGRGREGPGVRPGRDGEGGGHAARRDAVLGRLRGGARRRRGGAC